MHSDMFQPFPWLFSCGSCHTRQTILHTCRLPLQEPPPYRHIQKPYRCTLRQRQPHHRLMNFCRQSQPFHRLLFQCPSQRLLLRRDYLLYSLYRPLLYLLSYVPGLPSEPVVMSSPSPDIRYEIFCVR